MSVRQIRCGPFASQSEKKAAEYLEARLNGAAQGQKWVLLTNVSSSRGAEWLADELDLVSIGPTGVHVVEVKHWDSAYLKAAPPCVLENEANKLNSKAKRVKGRLERSCQFPLPFVGGKFLLTRGENSRYAAGDRQRQIVGVPLHGFPEWRELLELTSAPVLTDDQVEAVCRALVPAVQPSLAGDIRTFGPFIDLERASPGHDAFHRVYRGRHRSSRDRVVLHLYDLSASAEKNAGEVARREFAVMQRLQKHPWLPSLMDSFQEAPAYPGELYFFSYVDTEAPSLADRARDQSWSFALRLRFAERCLEALQELHQVEGAGAGHSVLHRNLSAESIRVRSSQEPLFTQLQFARLSDAATISGVAAPDFRGREAFVAPEVLASGLGGCSVASDVYSLCASLKGIFGQSPDEVPLADAVRHVLAAGTDPEPGCRASLGELREGLASIARPALSPVSEVPPLPVEYWDEDTVQEFRDRRYRIISRLGSGSVGTTFKVMEVDDSGETEISGPYVAKAITNEEIGASAAQAYVRVRAQTGGPSLAGVLEVATPWQRGGITALLRWIDGTPLSEWTGVLPLYLEEQGETDLGTTALRWARDLCEGLSHLHCAGLVHGDVSPKNIIVNGTEVTLTDFDLSTSAGSLALGGTTQYCAPAVDARQAVAPSDDLFALAGSLFHVLFDRPPFQHPTGLDKQRGLSWSGLEQNAWPLLAQFLNRATHIDPSCRFATAMEAIGFLDSLSAQPVGPEGGYKPDPALILQDNHVPWLGQLLQSYPASRKGNAETRGLDTDFARQTYVETELDRQLAEDILSRKVSLVVLCGNAGDGKTAFLQNLASKLGMEPGPSAQRLWDYTLPGGLRVRANLDGSAAYQGRSAQELLDEFFEPFQGGQFPEDLVHLIAVNDGPLSAWLDGQRTPLAEWLGAALMGDERHREQERTRFLDLNTRSLVGGLGEGRDSISTDFTDRLLEKLLGGGPDPWAPCCTCSAQVRCHAWRSVGSLRDAEIGPVIRSRLARLLQAAHHRGEVHITARGLRAALIYLFFGTQDCSDLHQDPSVSPLHYWDRAFDADSESRQGELLAELQVLDPGLDSHPEIDRLLLGTADGPADSTGRGPTLLRSLRRRAYFEWPEAKILQVGGSELALGLHRGRYLADFQRVATGTNEEREAICAALCEGIARLEDLPHQAFTGTGWPLKITPRTPTETAFWVSKPRSGFSLSPVMPRTEAGLETLHTHVELTYRFSSGHVESLLIGAALFDLLMEIKHGYQISDAQSDDVFAHLSIFKQRLAQEGDDVMYAWNPMDERTFKVRAELADGVQRLMIDAEGSKE